MSHEKLKVKVFVNGKGKVWRDSDRSFLSLCQYVIKKLNSNQFELQYCKMQDVRSAINNQNDLNEAFQIATDQARKDVRIYVVTNNPPSPVKSKAIDMEIFQDKSTDCDTNYICRCTRRIISAMKYYQTLNINVEHDKNKFLFFYDKIYPHILNDFTHVITKHPDSLDSLYEFAVKDMKLSKCTVQNCLYQQRHNRNRQHLIQLTQTQDIHFAFRRDIMDGVHCYTLHQYDFGFAIPESEKKAFIEDVKVEDENIACRDSGFAHIVKIIKKVKQNLKFARVNKNNNKFDFESEQAKEAMDVEYMEGMYECVENNSKRQTFKKFLLTEEYDSDAVLYDVRDESKSNLCCLLQKENFENIKEYVRICAVSSASFSTGFIFYYWKYYREPKSEEQEDDFRNINDHSGYKKHELFVEAKYKDLRCEIFSNNICKLIRCQYEISLNKAKHFENLEHSRKLVAADRDKELHYGIVKGTPILTEHLLAVILYTDWSEISQCFSMTFRKSKAYKPLQIVKKKNAEYAHWSKLLREAVQYYGQNGEGVYDKKKDTFIDKLAGPFFCGMSFEMPMPSFNIRLCGPVSTSVHIEFSFMFGCDYGRS
eukprot:156184_1